MAETGLDFDIVKIMRLLPHRYPFLLVDRVLEWEAFTFVKAIKNVTINEPFFQGHFPDLPIMPGVLILEALAQAGGVLVLRSLEDEKDDKIFMFTGIDKVRFRKPVRPGDQLHLHCFDARRKFNIWKMQGIASVNGEIATETYMTAALVNKSTLG